MYKKAFSKVEGVGSPKALPNSKSARHLFTIWVDPKKREQIMWKLQDQGIGVAVNF